MKKLGLLVILLAALGCGSSSAPAMMAPQPLNLNGQYSISINTTVDTCGLNLPGLNTALSVMETGPGAAIVDFPVAGACNPANFTRTGDTLTASGTEVASFDIGCGGLCNLQIDFATTLSFQAGGSVTGTETNTLSATGGACGCVQILPCSLDLSIGGNMCNGCFVCAATEASTEGESLLKRLLEKSKE